MPAAAILDPVLTIGLPQPLTASTGIDALTHAIETYTAVNATALSDLMAEQAIRLIGVHLRPAYANGTNLAARSGMLMGSLLAGIALAIANTAGVHALAQTLGGEFHVPHGVANALFLPYVMEFNRIACRERFARIAELLGEPVAGLSPDDASLRAVQAVQRLTAELGVPERLSALHVPENALDAVAQRCMETQPRLVANNPRTLTVDDARRILRNAY
jgi:alcohol dehydrogenase